MRRGTKRVLAVVLALLVAALLGLVGWRFWKEKRHNETVSRACVTVL